MDAAIALSVVPVIVGLVILALRLGLPAIYETPAAIVLGMAISLVYALAGQLPDGTVVADALLRGVAVGLTSAGLIATTRRFTPGQRQAGGERVGELADGTLAFTDERSRRAGGAPARLRVDGLPCPRRDGG